MGMRCWQCGVEPNNVVDTSSLGSVFSTRAPGRWPVALDHEHAISPPTPEELLDGGHRAVTRILAIAAE